MPVPLNSYLFVPRGDFLWGRMASCSRLEIGLLLISRKLRQADYQSAAGYQPALHGLLRTVAFLVLLSAAARTRIVAARLFFGNGLFFLDCAAAPAGELQRGHFFFFFALNIASEVFDHVLCCPALIGTRCDQRFFALFVVFILFVFRCERHHWPRLRQSTPTVLPASAAAGYLQEEQVADGLVFDAIHHVLEQREGFLLIFDQRVFLTVATQPNAFLQV